MLSAIDKLEFCERYDGLLTVSEIARELKTDVKDIQNIKREFGAICWTCRNACNGDRCAWVKTGIYPPYVTIAGDGKITGCLFYESDVEY